MQRRKFLSSIGYGAGSLSLAGLLPRSALASVADKTVVFIFQRGGADALNLVVPYGYDRTGAGYPNARYYEHRPNIAIAKPGEAFGALELANINGREAGVGLHPALHGLRELYAQGSLAILPAVQNSTRSVQSHPLSQIMIESGADDPRLIPLDGWLNRAMSGVIGAPDPDISYAMHFGSALPYSLGGDHYASVLSSLDDIERAMGVDEHYPLASTEQSLLREQLKLVYETEALAPTYAATMGTTGRIMFRDLDYDVSVFDNYQSAGATPYVSGSLSGPLKQAAYLLARPESQLRFITADAMGWDTHYFQGRGDASTEDYAENIEAFGTNIRAFYEDLSARGLMDKVLMFVVTEFGRTVHENGTQGTDHGHAAANFLIGSPNSLNGGVYLGREKSEVGGYPDGSLISDWIAYDPLDPAKDPLAARGDVAEVDLQRFAYMDHTIDYRDVYREILQDFLKLPDPSAVISYDPRFVPMGLLNTT